MKQNMQDTKIIGESFFDRLQKDAILLESDFVRLDRSIIWKCSDLFWKHYALWEKMYGEDFESSLPSGISESHKPEFINDSATRFLRHVLELEKKDKLPQKIYVYEQGPGTGIFAKGFLDYIKMHNEEIYKKIIYILTDTSEGVLHTCKKILGKHQKHTQYFDQENFEKLSKYDNKILFARHSNVWDGWPCRHIQVRQSGLGEVYVRAVCDKKFEYLIREIKNEGLETALLHNNEQWKDFFRSIKLQKRTISVDRIDIQDHIYLQHLSEIVPDHIGSNTLLSDLIVQNLSFLNRLIDWERNGYAEIVDIVTSAPRTIYPKKFDGAIGYIVDGHIITTWAKKNNKQVTFTPIRKLNTMVTITKKNKTKEITQMVQNATYEIFPTEKIIQGIDDFEKNTHIAVTATSKKGLEHTIDAVLNLREKGYNAYPHIIARQISDEKNLKDIQIKLAKNNIHESFVAAGDNDNVQGEFYSAMDVLHGLKKIGIPFETLAITGYPEGHPKISNKILLKALKEKQKFIKENTLEGRIISQLCFDADMIVKWAIHLKSEGINLPIVVGIAGPCNILQLAQFAIRCGVGESVKFLTSKKILGKNLTSHIALKYKPENIITDIVTHPLFEKSNIVGFHFYTFNNIKEIVYWQGKFLNTLEVKD